MINDFFAYENLFDRSTKSYLAFLICNNDTSSMSLRARFIIWDVTCLVTILGDIINNMIGNKIKKHLKNYLTMTF